MNNSLPVRLGLALVFALAAALAAGFVYQKRDQVFEWDHAKVHGSLSEQVNAAPVLAARALAEAKTAQACVVMPLAHDDRYLYAAIGCGDFKGAVTLLPSRLHLAGDSVSTLEFADKVALENSTRRLFPSVVWEKMRFGFPKAEILRAGLARMKERVLE